MENIQLEGYLTKVKQMNTGLRRISVHYSAKKRWYQLQGHELRYYDTAEHAQARKHESLLGFIDIFDVQSVRKVSNSRPNTFQIVTKRKGSIALVAETEESRDDWIAALQLAMRLKRSTMSISDVELFKTARSDSGESTKGQDGRAHENASDAEYWNKESTASATSRPSQTYETVADAEPLYAEVSCGNDDVFDDETKRLYDVIKEKETTTKTDSDCLYDEINIIPQKMSEIPEQASVNAICADDKRLATGEGSESVYAVINKPPKSERTQSNQGDINTCISTRREPHAVRESGYETTDTTDTIDYEYDAPPSQEIKYNCEQISNNDNMASEEETRLDSNDQYETTDGVNIRAIDVLKDMLKHTHVIECEVNELEDGMTAMEKLRLLLGEDD